MEPLELLKSGEDADFTISIGEQQFQLHSFVLRAGCKYFRSQGSFASATSGGRNAHTFPPDEVDPRVFQAILTFIYGKVFEPPEKCTADEWKKAFILADYLQIQGFKQYMLGEPGFKQMKRSIEAEATTQDSPNLWLVEQLQKASPLESCAPLQRALLAVVLAQLMQRPACAYFIRTFFHAKIGSNSEVTEQWKHNAAVSHADISFIVEICGKLVTSVLAADEAPLEQKGCKRRAHELMEENALLREKQAKLQKLEEENTTLKEQLQKAKDAHKEQLQKAKDALKCLSDVLVPSAPS